MYNLIENNDNYTKISWSLWQSTDEPFLHANSGIAYFLADSNNSALFEFKTKRAGRIGNNGQKDVEIMTPLKHLSDFWRTLEIPLINCEINLVLTWSTNFFIINVCVETQVPTFTITDAKRYVPLVTLSTHDNPKLLQ